MSRVNRSEIREILEDDANIANHIIDVFITTANILVTDALGSSSLSSSILKEIERYITAHLIAQTKIRQTQTEEVDDVRATYTGKFGEGLKATTYGQVALTLDTSGKLGQLGKREAVFKAITSFQ